MSIASKRARRVWRRRVAFANAGHAFMYVNGELQRFDVPRRYQSVMHRMPAFFLSSIDTVSYREVKLVAHEWHREFERNTHAEMAYRLRALLYMPLSARLFLPEGVAPNDRDIAWLENLLTHPPLQRTGAR